MRNKTSLKVWSFPLLLAALIISGLLAALLGTGIWYFFSWLAMSIPIIVVLYNWIKHAKKHDIK
jgi:hypothetical protein